ncbi:MAG: hypothetical protein U5L00_13695 [Desulfovermiculus sp.]|nr:hypothetical protein [Desulfovermiculus sp.]
MNLSLKTGLHWAGTGLGLAGIVFVGIRLYLYSGDLDFQRFGFGAWIVFLTLAFIYGCANFLLAAAWWNILNMLQVRADISWSIRTYGVSQLAKYIPGNIFQFAGRQALGVASDLPGWALAKSVFWELALISLAGSLFACLAAPSVIPELAVFWAAIIFLCIIFIASAGIKYIFGVSAAKAFGLYLFFLFVSGMVFVGTLLVVSGGENISLAFIVLCGSSYILAWLAGLVTPGAPAGMGVREVVILFLLGAQLAEADLLLAVLLNRIITVAGDAGFFSWASLTGSLTHGKD